MSRDTDEVSHSADKVLRRFCKNLRGRAAGTFQSDPNFLGMVRGTLLGVLQSLGDAF
jgi:hypothetical protein